MRTKRFGNTLPVRLQEDVNDRLKQIAKAAGISKSDALRMALRHGLVQLEQGKISLKTLAA